MTALWMLEDNINCSTLLFKVHFSPLLIVFAVPVPGGVGSCPLLLLPSVLW